MTTGITTPPIMSADSNSAVFKSLDESNTTITKIGIVNSGCPTVEIILASFVFKLSSIRWISVAYWCA